MLREYGISFRYIFLFLRLFDETSVYPMKHHKSFFSEVFTNFQSIGAIAPSSESLAESITHPLDQTQHLTDRKLLEVGAGSGAITNKIIEKIQPGDHLTIVELNDKFYRQLKARLAGDESWKMKASQISLVNGDVLAINSQEPFDIITCSLPFYNFEPELVDKIFNHLFNSLSTNGHFSCFLYAWITYIKLSVSSRESRERLTEIRSIFQSYGHLLEGTDHVFTNFPPAKVYHYVKRV